MDHLAALAEASLRQAPQIILFSIVEPARPEPAESIGVASAKGIVLTPDFVGETVSGARRIARNASFELLIPSHALGRAVSQDPPPGTVLDGSTQKVRIRFAPTQES